MTKRNVAVVIVLSLVTCGIYSIYWFVVTTNDIERSLAHPDGSVKSGGMAFLFSLITCGIYTYYWWYKQGQRVAQMQNERGLNVTDNAVVYLILSIFGLSIVGTGLIQSALNGIVDACCGDDGNTYNNGNGYNNGGYNNGNGYNNGGYNNGNGYNNGGYNNGNGYNDIGGYNSGNGYNDNGGYNANDNGYNNNNGGSNGNTNGGNNNGNENNNNNNNNNGNV